MFYITIAELPKNKTSWVSLQETPPFVVCACEYTYLVLCPYQLGTEEDVPILKDIVILTKSKRKRDIAI